MANGIVHAHFAPESNEDLLQRLHDGLQKWVSAGLQDDVVESLVRDNNSFQIIARGGAIKRVDMLLHQLEFLVRMLERGEPHGSHLNDDAQF